MWETRITKVFAMAIIVTTVWLGHATVSNAQDRIRPADKISVDNSLVAKESVLIGNPDEPNSVTEDKYGLIGSPTKAVVSREGTKPMSASPSTAPAGLEGWQFEIRPYIWLAGIDGTLRVRNTSAKVGKDSKDVLGMLDFAAAAQVEAIKGPWRVMFDENYVNLGTTGTGPLGNGHD
jgi:hypothetical protein